MVEEQNQRRRLEIACQNNQSMKQIPGTGSWVLHKGHASGSMRVMHLDPAERLFGAQPTNVPIPFMHLVGHDILPIILQKPFKFPSFINPTIDSDLGM